MKLTLIGNGIMAQSLARGLIKNHEVEIIGMAINKLLVLNMNSLSI
jgi:pyrroline-5-carboxylate reductase